MRNLFNLSILSKLKANRLENYPRIFRNYAIPIQHKFLKVYSARCYAFTNIQIHSAVNKSGKKFQEIENEYAHTIMEKLLGYSGSVLKYPLVVDKSTVHYPEKNVFDDFAKVTLGNLSVALSLENVDFSDLVNKLCASLSEASDEDIQKTLHYLCLWPPTPNTYTPNFKALWNTLDAECTKRLKRWNVNHKLLIADYWFYLRLNRISLYNTAMIADIVEKIDSLSTQQVVQLMFYINLQRKIPQSFFTSIERQLRVAIDSMTIEEVGIICLGFFKTKKHISDLNLIQCIAQQLIRNVETANHVTVVGILKCLRKNFHKNSHAHLHLRDVYINVLHKCIPYIKNWDIPTSVHLALLSEMINVYHPLLLDTVCEKFITEISDSRIKDCSKLLHCLSHFNYYKKELHDLILSEVKKKDREEELYSHPQYVIHLALYYAYFGDFNNDLLSIIFQKRVVQYCSTNRPETIRAIAEADCCTEIEFHDYSGPKLDKNLRKVLEKERGNLLVNSEQQNMQTRLLYDVNDIIIEVLGGNENVCIKHILPHFYAPDIIVRLTSKTEKSLSEICHDIPSDVILRPPSNELWACFVIGGIFSFAHKSKQMTGRTAMKLRQLNKLGYHVIFIPYFDLPKRNISQRKQFLKEKLDVLKAKHRK